MFRFQSIEYAVSLVRNIKDASVVDDYEVREILHDRLQIKKNDKRRVEKIQHGYDWKLQLTTAEGAVFYIRYEKLQHYKNADGTDEIFDIEEPFLKAA